MDVLDRLEAYKIMSEVFFDYIPDKDKIKALGQVAERFNYELKTKDESK